MNILDILAPYAQRPTSTEQDFDEVARQVPADVLGDGITQAFRADSTPSFGSMIGSLFGGSNPQQRAGVLGHLLQTLGPAVLSGLAGGGLGRLAQRAGVPGTKVSPDDVVDVTPRQIEEIAGAAEKADPGILDRLGQFYAEHPEVVKVLGGAALAVALGRMAQRPR